MKSLGLILNEDSSHFYVSRSSEEMTVEHLNAFIDQYADTQVSHLFLNPNSQRTSYRSDVWDNIWEHGNQEPPVGPNDRNWVDNAKLLDKKGIDPYQVWIKRARENNISPWISMRMNDVHDLHDLKSYIHSSFWINHPELRRGKKIYYNWADIGFDYALPEVREYHMKLIREYFERYDFDGLELDWMRFGYHFKPGFEEEGNDILTKFHCEVRQLADEYSKRRGHPIKIGVRVPSRPQTARGMGLYPIPWVRAGAVDLVTITPFFATIEFDMPIELWKDLLGDMPVTLAAGLEVCLSPTKDVWPKYAEAVLNSEETACGAALSLLHRGADQIYLFNYMDRATKDNPDKHRPVLTHAGALATLIDVPRRHVVTYADTWAIGEAPAYPLPVNCRKKQPVSFRIPIGPKPAKCTAYVWIGLGEKGCLDPDGLRIEVNNIECPRSDAAAPVPIHPIAQRTVGFNVASDILHDGFNVVQVLSDRAGVKQIVWVEIFISPA